MKSILSVLTLSLGFLVAASVITGCNSKSGTSNKMEGDKMGMEDKMKDDKMGSDKMGTEKMDAEKAK